MDKKTNSVLLEIFARLSKTVAFLEMQRQANWTNQNRRFRNAIPITKHRNQASRKKITLIYLRITILFFKLFKMSTYKANMKTLFGAAVFLVSTPCACAYIEELPMGTAPSPFSVNSWTPKSFSPKIRIRPMGDLGEAKPRDDEISIDATAEGIIRREYGAWLKRYDKVRSTKRFAIFKRNFIAQMEMNRKSGQFFLLNEYGDLTEAEYVAELQKSQESKMYMDYENEQSYEEKFPEYPADTLPPAPVMRLEDLTQEVLSSALDASRKSVTEEFQPSTALKEDKYDVLLNGGVLQPEKSLSWNSYSYLLDLASERAQELGTNIGAHKVFASYFDFVSLKMIQPDELDLLPSLISSAMTSFSQTLKTHLIERVEEEQVEEEVVDMGGWEQYAYAMDFEDNSEEYTYYYE